MSVSCEISNIDEDQTMCTSLRIGQTLKGELGSYTLAQKLYSSVWRAT
jgi:hypothetical protein